MRTAILWAMTWAVLGSACSGTSDESVEKAAESDDAATPETEADSNTLPDIDQGNCTHNSFEISSQSVVREMPGPFVFRAQRDNGDGHDRLEVRIQQGGVFPGASGTGTYDIGGSTYEECFNCVIIRMSCSDTGECEQVFFATEGTLEITQWDETAFRASLSELLLKEVNMNNSIAIMPKLGGDTFCIGAMTLDASSAMQPGPLVPESSCTVNPNASFLGQNIADLSLPNCNGDAVSLHAACGAVQAMWLLGTTGWCVPCSAKLKKMASEHNGLLSRAAIAEQTPGLDMLIILTENALKKAVTPEYCQAYAEEHSLDPAMVLMDYNPQGVAVPLWEPLGGTHTFESMAATWSAINPYLREQSAGRVKSSFPWNALLDGQNMAYYWSEFVGVSTFEGAKQALLSR